MLRCPAGARERLLEGPGPSYLASRLQSHRSSIPLHRLERNARREAEDARGKLVQELLPVLDNLDRTIRAANGGRDPAILEGVRLVRHQLEGVLRGYGVERIEALDQRFDPNLHEAIGVASVSDPRRHGIVVHQAEPGYRFGDRLLRPAKVSVGKLVSPVDTVHRPVWR